jgi:RNA polymerase sigma-70 factor (ECF subfamily)
MDVDDYLYESQMLSRHGTTEVTSDAAGRLLVFERILREYEIPLRRLTVSYVFEQADRDDLYQEITAAIWTALPRFRGDSSERTWVYRIAHNIAISASVRSRRRTQRETLLRQDTISKSLDPEAQSLESEQRRLLIEAVRSIRGLDKQIIVLHLEGLTNGELAEVVGLTEGAVATRLTRVRTQLAQFVKTRTGQE